MDGEQLAIVIIAFIFKLTMYLFYRMSKRLRTLESDIVLLKKAIMSLHRKEFEALANSKGVSNNARLQ